MTPQLSRALVLIDQNRYEQAIGELQLHLGQEAEDPLAHALLAQCLLALDRYDEAERMAQQAVALAPDTATGYRVLAAIYTERNRLAEAQQAIDIALQMDAEDAELYALKSAICAKREKWRDAVDAANQGLAIEPEHLGCINLRTHALVMLGERRAAAETVADALRRNPDDPWLHANQGYACLHANDPKQAAEHFREALRLDPTMDFARAGIIEALKARNIIYRGMLMYFLWMTRLSSQARWGIVIGLFVLSRVLRGVSNNNPELTPYVTPVLISYGAFVVMTWISYPLFNLLLRLDRFGKYALSAEERKGANLLGATLLIAIAGLIGFFVTFNEGFLGVALIFGCLALPISAIYQLEGWPRYVMMAATGLVFLIGSPAMIPPGTRMIMLFIHLQELMLGLFPMALLGSQFLAMALSQVRVKK